MPTLQPMDIQLSVPDWGDESILILATSQTLLLLKQKSGWVYPPYHPKMPPRAVTASALTGSMCTALPREGMRFLHLAPGFKNLPFRGSVLLLATTFLHDSHGVLSACFFPFSISSLCSSLHFPLDNLTHCSSAATIFIPNCSLSALPLSAHLSPLKSTLQPAPVTSHPGQHVGNLAWMCQAELNYSFFSSNSSLSTLAVRAALHSRHYSTDILPKALYMMNVSHIENTLCCRCSN